MVDTTLMDKLHHLVYAYAVALTVGLLFGVWAGFLAGCAVGLAKDLIWDLWMGRGQFEMLDIAAAILGAALISLVPL